MIKFHVTITGLVEAQKKLGNLKSVLKDNTDVMEKVGKWFLSFLTEDVFATDGGALDAPWPELTERTIAEKVRLGYSGQGILQRTGTLQGGWELYTTSSYALLKNPVPYAIYHDSDAERSRLPQRKLIKFSNQVQDEIKNRFKQAIIDKVKRAVA